MCKNGKVSFPECIEERCRTRTVTNGKLHKTFGNKKWFRYDMARHGVELEVKCDKNYTLTLAGQPLDRFTTRCHYGAWNNSIELSKCIIGITTELPEIETTAGQITISDTASSPEAASPTAASQTATSPSTTPDHIDDIGSDSKEPDGITELPEIETTSGQKTTSDTATSPEATSPTAASQNATSPSPTDTKEPDGNCTVPQSKMQYTDNRTALNGEIIVAKCQFDDYVYSSFYYDYTEENITCIDGQFEGSWPSCEEKDISCSNLQNGTVLYKQRRPIVTCDEGFSLHVNEHSKECIDGALQTNKGREVKCFPDHCLVPGDHEGRRIFLGINKSEILEKQKVVHHNWVNISCSEPKTEPAYRQFICVAGKWKLDGRTVWDITKEHDTFPECRAAVCSVPCKNEGVCIRDNVCECPAGTQLPNCDADPCNIGNDPNIQRVIESSQDVVHGDVKDGTIVLFSCMNGYSFDSEEEHIRRTCSRGHIHIPECKELEICQTPCQNGGTCVNGQCQCSANTYGNACQTVKCPKPDRKNYVPKISAYYPGNTIEAICCTDENKCEVSRDECLMDGSWRIGGSCREDCFQMARNKHPRWGKIDRKYKYHSGTNSIISCFIACLENQQCQSVAFKHTQKWNDCYCIYTLPNNSEFFTTNEQQVYQTAFC